MLHTYTYFISMVTKLQMFHISSNTIGGLNGLLQFMLNEEDAEIFASFLLEAGAWSNGKGFRAKCHSFVISSLPLLKTLTRTSKISPDGLIIQDGDKAIIESLLCFFNHLFTTLQLGWRIYID